MGLSVRFVETLDQVVDPVIEHLTSTVDEIDLFETELIVVPNAGVRAWLLQQLAHRLGATDGKTNGAVGNIEIGFVGMLDRLILPDRAHEDPWHVDHLTFAVLHAIGRLVDDAEVVANVNRLGGGLKAARVLADRFDRYHARRPHMIRCWEAGRVELSPFIGEESILTESGEREAMLVVQPLAEADRWQFTLWRAVRDMIGTPSPPARSEAALATLSNDPGSFGVPKRIAIVGLQSISARHLEVVRALAQVTEVSAMFVHPSPELAAHWATAMTDRPVAPGIAIARSATVPMAEEYDQTVHSWLRGSMDLQQVLAVNGLGAATHVNVSARAGNNLLSHVQRAVTRPSDVSAHPVADDDQSLLVHRAHNLARQVEVLHDALLHAFDQLPDLQPHEVVIMSPVIDKAAPLLQATFQREVTTKNGSTFTLPVVIADRGLREVDEGSRLLADLVVLLRGRFGIADMLPVITSPLVLARFGMGPDDVDTWKRYMERARVRWGLDDVHRASAWGVDLGDEGMAHTWSLTIKRSLLGALLPDAENPNLELGGVVPIVDVEPGEIRAITTLAEIVQILADAQRSLGAPRGVGEWCEMIDQVISRLADDEQGSLDEARTAIVDLRRHSSVPCARGDIDVVDAVEFAHVAALISDHVTSAPGRQPLRTGAITATSMIPLRSVPFRVVCVVGFDDGAMSTGDAEGDDLESRQNLIGDIDTRLEQRRMLLDAVVSASDRVIITCVGRSVKNNVLTQLVTPLAELVDLCRQLGVGERRDPKDVSLIEILHKRHFNSPANFVKGQIVPGVVWSHSRNALAAAQAPTAVAPTATVSRLPVEPLQVVPLEMLEQLVQDPLRIYLRDTLGINTWRQDHDDEPAVIPLALTSREKRTLASSLFGVLSTGGSVDDWEAAVIASGDLPPLVYRQTVVSETVDFVRDMIAAVSTWDHSVVEDIDVSLPLGDGRVLRGRIPAVHTREDGTKFLLRVAFDKYHDSLKAVIPLHMVVLSALGHDLTDAPYVTRHDKDDTKASRRNIQPDEPLVADDSLRRLVDLADLAEVARSLPCASFGGAGLLAPFDRTKAETAFQKHLGAFNFRTSDEALVHGFLPVFDDVFAVDSPVVDFWEKVAGALVPAVDSKKNSPASWRRYGFR